MTDNTLLQRLVSGGESQDELVHLCTYLAPTEIELLLRQIASLEKRLEEAIEVRHQFSEYANLQSNESIRTHKQLIHLRRLIHKGTETVEDCYDMVNDGDYLFNSFRNRVIEECAAICDDQHDRARTSPGAARADSCASGIRNLKYTFGY